MAPIIENNCVEYAAEGTINGRKWVNVWHMEVIPFTGDNRADVIRTVAKRLVNGYHGMSEQFPSAWTFQKVRWVDLDSANGSTGEETHTGVTASAPFSGGSAATPSPGNVAVLVKKLTTGGRAERNGRCYLPVCREDYQEGNNLSSTGLTTLQAELNTFFSTVNDWDPGSGTTSDNRLVVLHARPGVDPSTTPITSLAVQSTLATQRRRLRS